MTSGLLRERYAALWILFAVAVIMLGLGLRFYNLDRKVYSFDETVTSIRASGHSIAEFMLFVDDGKTHQLSELNKFQRYDPATKTANTVRSLAVEEPQHPPLYFLLARSVSWWGATEVWQRRLPAALFGALLIAAFWRLTFELFHSKAAAWVGSVLVAVSPFHLAYAQQDREYSLWALGITVSSVALLQALRRSNRWSWLIYALIMTTTLWTYTLSVYLLLSHTLFVFFGTKAGRVNSRRFIAAAGAAFLGFCPWLYMIVTHSAKVSATTAWDSAALPAKIMAEKWLFNATAVFFDLDYLSLRFLPIVGAVVLLGLVSVVIMIRFASSDASKFVLILGGVSGTVMLAFDLVLKQSHSTESRYLTPLWLAVELAVAFAAGVGGWGTTPFRGRVSGLWRAATVSLVVLGAMSCIVSSQARYWWIASDAKAIPAIAQLLNGATSNPLIAYTGDAFYLLELSDVVRNPLRFRLGDVATDTHLRSEKLVYLIGKPVQMSQVAAEIDPRSLKRVPLPAIFPKQDDSVTKARSEGAAARNSSRMLDDISLWALAERTSQ